ncbi:NUDIX hydrolase [Tuwongella immobilis]|uniref:Nudix hydrolase domain-containing protein n=1 Tax=Tuwongella immobilis TaxID=692036 RepID=A0A6C2YTH7_9BACT|nr:NUDIX hydrolase [Tuwongella immobilis]VIP04647.1 nudix hydrolase : NUDIX hydrolase OS=Microcoleus vaginatus FGP-2 GN=MicvaDRAFT_4086 PE=4 SV=1: NUDIX [Tuwongella immobilis]VTS06655.1 nudix hydrolase : NUDIX hydrolase OS=Microcoleus vaginatus FGP-2 GN=MicvaDRAFT_4086 PE=4 SV=1: NUDIX [Tuwongella immobilis]
MAEWMSQAAAIPMRDGQICLVSSSGGRRWVIPKGAIELGHTAGQTALIEAWEEAGLVGSIQPEPVGSYLYEKDNRINHVVVFLMQVHEESVTWPEQGKRSRIWVSIPEAIEKLQDASLRDLLTAVFLQPTFSTLA